MLRLGDEERRLMHLVPAPAVKLMKRRVLSRPGVDSVSVVLPQPLVVHSSPLPPLKGGESKDWANVLSVSSSSKKTKRTLIKTQLIMKDLSGKNLLSFDEL